MADSVLAYDSGNNNYLDHNNPTFIRLNNNFTNNNFANFMGNTINVKNDSVLNDSDSALLLTDMDNEGYESSSRRLSCLSDNEIDMSQSLGDHCHAPLTKDDIVARNQLIAVSAFCFLFMVAEIAGGFLANSLAIATDAMHLACDLAGFLVSLFAIWIAKKPPTKKLSFGYYRAEVIGALCSILLIWVVTVILVVMAVKRIQDNTYEVDGQPMIITASLGVLFNIIMGIVLHSGLCKCCSNLKTSFGHGHSHGGHGHSHGGHGHSHRGHGHSQGGHAHSHEDGNHLHNLSNSTTSINNTTTTTHNRLNVNINGNDGVSINSVAGDDRLIVNDVEGGHTISHSSANTEDATTLTFKGSDNINVRAAFIHVVGDLIQSIGVFVAAIIIMIKPEYKLADPICTFIFSFLVLCTTLTVLRDVMIILMEGVPRSINYASVKQSLSSLPGVISVHSLNIWSITVDKLALNVHIAIAEETADWRKVLLEAVDVLRKQYNIHHPTVQIEPYNDRDMKNCRRCQFP